MKILRTINNLIKDIISWRFRRKAKRKLLKQYSYNLTVEKILEDWITKAIIERKHQGRRDELVEKQKRISEMELFIDYLKKLK